MKLLTRNRTPSPFDFRSPVSPWDPWWAWLRWLGYLACLITAIQTSSYLFGYPEANLMTISASLYGTRILRPGQYYGTVGVWDKVADEDSPEPDVLGMAHDRRFVSISKSGGISFS